MSTITKDYGSGGAGLNPGGGASSGNGSKRHPSLAKVLRDIADDFATIKTRLNSAAIGSADPAAIAASALAATLITTADADGTWGSEEADLVNELKADLNIAATLINEIRATTVANRTLAIELKNEVTGIVTSSPDPTAVSAAALADPLVLTADADATYGAPEVTLINEIKVALNLAATLINQLRTTAAETRTLLMEMKTDLNAAAPIGTLLTLKG